VDVASTKHSKADHPGTLRQGFHLQAQVNLFSDIYKSSQTSSVINLIVQRASAAAAEFVAHVPLVIVSKTCF
jgi:hypothetical protein